MEEFFKAIEDKIGASGYPGQVSGEEIYNAVSYTHLDVYKRQALEDSLTDDDSALSPVVLALRHPLTARAMQSITIIAPITYIRICVIS